ncbi:hypothetical protein CYQ16_03785 [Enterococcus faecalis]|nr:hypothetical protein CYQ16_03785 [Enterococcus faecalis]
MGLTHRKATRSIFILNWTENSKVERRIDKKLWKYFRKFMNLFNEFCGQNNIVHDKELSIYEVIIKEEFINASINL